MSHHAKTPSAGSNTGQAGSLGSSIRGGFAIRGARAGVDGSGARSSRSSRLRGVAFLCLAIAVAMALIASPAFAVKAHTLSTSFGTEGSGSGQVLLTQQSGVAVNEASHDIYVADTGNHRIDQFGSTGTFVRAFGADVGGPGVDVCTSDCQAGTAASSPGAFQTPAFIAIDNSAGASEGDVYIADTTTNLVSKFQADGTLVSSWGNGGQLDGSAATSPPEPVAGPFAEVVGIAVDSSGNLDVLENSSHALFRFAQDGSLLQDFETPRGSSPNGLAVDSDGDFFKANGDFSVEKFKGSGVDVGQVNNQPSTTGLAVDTSNGELFVDNGGSIDNFVFGPSGEVLGSGCTPAEFSGCPPTGTFGGQNLIAGGGLAVDGTSHTVYAADPGAFKILGFASVILPGVIAEEATDVTGATATLHASVNPDNLAVSECKFEYGPTAAYGSSKPCEGTIPTDGSNHSVAAALSGLEAGTTYHWRIVATNANGANESSDQTFTTKFPPAIEAEWVASAGLTEATLAAKINPKGVATTYHIEYGTDTSYGTSTPESPLGAENEGLTVSNTLEGLAAGATYHWRVVATSAVGVSKGPDRTFATYLPPPAPETGCPAQAFRTGPSAVLPDCRAYEQTTTLDKHGANIEGSVGVVQASSDGGRITFADAGGLPSSGGSSTVPVYFSSRGGDSWSSNGLVPLTEPGRSANILGWDEEITSAATVKSSAAGQDISLFNTSTGISQQVGSGFVEALAGFADDSEHFTLESPAALAPGAVFGSQNLYDLDHGTLTLAGRIPVAPATSCDDAGAPACVPAPEGSFAGPYARSGFQGGGEESTTHGGATQHYYTENTISDDGSKIFFTAAGSAQLYVREDGTKTTQVSASQAATPDPNGHKPAAFMAATPSGSKVFFSSCEKLTDDSTAVSTAAETCGSSEQGQDLYSYDTGSGDLTDLTVDSNAGDPQHAGVVGVLGASADGSYVYFAANGVLAPGGSVGDCGISGFAAQQGTCNLYVAHAGAVTFIARLRAAGDGFNWLPYQEFRQTKESRVAADGTLIFGSTRSLTGYENVPPSGSPGCGEDSGANKPCSELFRYSPSGEELTCVSCNPTQLAPLGAARLENERTAFGAGPKALFLTRNITPDGNRVFFDTPDPLVIGDTNGVTDPYEWEADGTGSCRSAEANGGCLYLLTTGSSVNPSYLGDISTSGDDAFVFTNQRLVQTDKDDLVDVYDARVDGGLASQHFSEAPACLGEACRGASTSAPDESSPGSAGFNGSGNKKEKPKQKKCQKHAKAKCKKSKKHKKSKSKKSRGANTNRGGSK